jgi:hypothetical protein
MPLSTTKLLLLGATMLLGAVPHAQAQAPPQGPPCDGLRVSRIDIQPGRPPFSGQASRWRAVARAIGLHHATTRDGVVDAFMALDVGQTCTEVRRVESERVLRAQPFLADATVRTMPDGAGGVVVVVQTVDEIPVLINARFRGIAPRAFSLGSANVGGLGLLAEVMFERGYAYRNGYGVRLVEYAAFGRPYVASIDAEQQTLGHRLRADFEHPFYTDLQHIGWHAGYLTSNEYPGLRRPARDELALGVRQERWEGSAITRVFGTSTVGLIGGAASGLRLTPQPRGIVVSDTGLAADTGITLVNRYAPFRATRVGVLGGIRRVHFRTVRGFDALTAQQDVPNGAFAGLYVAKGLPSFGESDVFLSGLGYAGGGGEHVYYGTMAQWEGRRGTGLNRWDSIIGSARSALYLGRGPGWMLTVDDQFSGGTRSLLPLPLAGAYRNIGRAEMRWSGAALVRGADVGFAGFGQLGSIWAGDAPYGTTATRGTVGISILAAYPTGSKRLYRADVGIPLVRGGDGGGKIEVRFSSEDRTQLFWREPDDVSRARTGTVPANLFAFPVR